MLAVRVYVRRPGRKLGDFLQSRRDDHRRKIGDTLREEDLGALLWIRSLPYRPGRSAVTAAPGQPMSAPSGTRTRPTANASTRRWKTRGSAFGAKLPKRHSSVARRRRSLRLTRTVR